jgi:hypothetical protein
MIMYLCTTKAEMMHGMDMAVQLCTQEVQFYQKALFLNLRRQQKA